MTMEPFKPHVFLGTNFERLAYLQEFSSDDSELLKNAIKDVILSFEIPEEPRQVANKFKTLEDLKELIVEKQYRLREKRKVIHFLKGNTETIISECLPKYPSWW